MAKNRTCFNSVGIDQLRITTFGYYKNASKSLYILNIFEALKSVIFNLKKKKVLFIMKSGNFQGM